MFGQKSKNQKEEERREEEEEGGRKKCRGRGRKKKSKPAVGVGGPARFPGRRLGVLHSVASLRGGIKNLRSNLGTRRRFMIQPLFFFKSGFLIPKISNPTSLLHFMVYQFLYIYIVVCDLNMKITGIALFGCSLGFSDFFFVIGTQDSILLNLNPNGHIVEAKIEISLFNPVLLMNSDHLYLPKFS